MSGFDATERPLWTLLGAAYLALLEPLRDRPARTLRQIGAHPRRDDLENRGYALTQSMPTLAVYVGEGRVEDRTTQSLDWHIDVDVHCFCSVLDQGDELGLDQANGMRTLTQLAIEHLHARVPTSDDIEAGGIDVRSNEPFMATENLDWWVVRTVVPVRHWIRRQRTPGVDGIEARQFGHNDPETPLATTIVDFETASAQITEKPS